MDAALAKRIERIKQVTEEFDLNQSRIAEYAERSRTTVTKLFGGLDERYLTESNVAAIEKGIEKILEEYRKKLCK
jgi:DNA transposition AAA+ family ATPase